MFIVLPIGHENAWVRRVPWVSAGIAALALIIQIGAGAGAWEISGYAPADGNVFDMVLSAFQHLGWFHLLGNLLFLYLTGCNLEDRWGRPFFAGFYVLAAIVSAGTYAVWHPQSLVPVAGASGAVAACMGAFAVLFWKTKVRFFYAYWFFLRPGGGTFSAPAWAALLMWFLVQLFFSSFEAHFDMSTAYSAHVGGFVFGLGIGAMTRFTSLGAKLHAAATPEKVEVWTEDPRFLEAVDLRQRDAPRALELTQAVLLDTPDHKPARTEAFELGLELAREDVVRGQVDFRYASLVSEDAFSALRMLHERVRTTFPNLPLSEIATSHVVTAGRALGDGELTVGAVRQLMSHKPDASSLPRLLLAAADAQFESGRRDFGRKTLQQVVDRWPDSPFARQASQLLANEG